jgi:signal transduction histidine kinase
MRSRRLSGPSSPGFLPFFVNAIRQQAAQQVEEERGEQTLAALKRAVAMSQGAIAETRRS